MRQLHSLSMAGFLALTLSVTSFAADLGLGQRAELDNPTRWERWPSALAAPSSGAAVEVVAEGLVFTVPEPEHEMVWRRAMRPAWLDFHPYLTFRYRATGLPTGDSYPLLRLRTGSEAWFTVLHSLQLQSDGASHTETLDLASLTSSDQMVGIELRLRSGLPGAATLVVEQLQFTDQPPGYVYPPPPAPTPVLVGFELDVSTASSWQARPEWLSPSNIATDYSAHSSGASLIFAVTDAGRGMKWSNSSIGTLDTATCPYALMRYRCRHLQASTTNYALWLGGPGGTESRPFYQADLIDDGLWHWGFAPITIPSVNQMAFQDQSDSSGGSFIEIEALRFVSGDPRSDLSYFTSLTDGWSGLAGGTSGFSLIDLSALFNARADQLLPRMGLSVPWFSGKQVAAEPWIPFEVETGNPNLVATGLPGLDTLEIPIGQSAGEIYLLLGAFIAGREDPSSEQIIAQVDEIERFYIHVEYEDGTFEAFFPLEVFSGLHKIQNNTFSAFAIPADPARTIRKIHLLDRTDGGLFALAALTLKNSPGRYYGEAFEIPPPETAVTVATPDARPVSARYSSGRLTLENTYARYEFDLSAGVALEQWISHYTGHDLMSGAPDHRFFSGIIEASPFTSLSCNVTGVETWANSAIAGATMHLELEGYEGIIEATLAARIGPDAEADFALAVDNLGASSYAFELLLPDLKGLSLGEDSADLHYAYPSRTFALGNQPVQLENYYSGSFPMQFMDGYDPTEGWGVYLLVKDLNLIHKYYSLSKSEEGLGLSVRYPTLTSTGLPAGGRLESAPFALGLHAGDWHAAMDAYRQWVSTWYVAHSPRQRWFQEIYTCRRDYPVWGTGYLFDRTLNHYTFDAEIANASRYLGGADMIDISSWGWSATYGRVGDYRRYELGGLEDFREGIAYSQSSGIPVGLYIEGYLLDARSTAYSEHGDEWKLLNASGTEIRSGAYEVFMCPYAIGWQDYMQALYAGVITDTSAAAMYIDVFGAAPLSRSCYSGEHGHPIGAPPLRGEYQLTRKVRQGLNAIQPGIPLYTEYTPADVISQYQDGSFSYTIWYSDAETCPTETNLFRFCFPDFKQIELVNGLFLARNWTEEGLKKAFFNGEGIWVKGDIPSWYDASTVAFYQKSHEIFRDHRDAFTTDHPEPFLSTLAGNVYAHRFAEGEKQILTFYNANRRDVDTPLVEIGPLSNKHVVDLWGEVMLETVSSAANYAAQARLLPRDIGCVGIFERRFEARLESLQLMITLLGAPAPGDRLEIVAVHGQQRQIVRFPMEDTNQTIDLEAWFDPLPDKVLVKYKQDGIVRDEVILDGPGSPTGLSRGGWTTY